MLIIKSAREIEKMKVVGKMVAKTLSLVGDNLRNGISGKEIEEIVRADTEQSGGICAPFGYKGRGETPFPGFCCISENNVVAHGIPNNKSLKDCIVNVDLTTIFDGYHGDTSATFILGDPGKEAIDLVKKTHQAMMAGIYQIKPGARLGDVGSAVQKMTEDAGFSIVKDLGGHSIGLFFHEEPFVSHYGTPGLGQRLYPGMCITVEPILSMGSPEIVLDQKDKWTVTSWDNSWTAQEEHTILVTETGFEILTRRDRPLKNSIETL